MTDMKRLLISSPKGGCGKTMISRNLAVAAALENVKVATLDLDPQASLTRWWNRRAEERPPIVHYQGTMNDAQDAMAEIVGHELLIIDTPTAVEEYPHGMKALILGADLVLVPTKPTMDDTDSTMEWMTMLRSYDRPAAFVLNMAKLRARSLPETKRRLNAVGRICPIEIAEREDMHRIGAEGLGILEVSRHPGGDEIGGVWQFVKNEMGA